MKIPKGWEIDQETKNSISICNEKGSWLVRIFKDDFLHTTVINIQQCRVERESENKLLELLNSWYEDRKKDKGEVIVYVTGYKGTQFVQKTMVRFGIESSADSKEVGISAEWGVGIPRGEIRDFHSHEEEGLCVEMIDKEKIKRNTCVLKKVREAIELCIENGYLMYGTWDITKFDYLMGQKGDYKIEVTAENGEYILFLDEKKVIITNDDVQKIYEKIMLDVEGNIKKERLHRLIGPEETSLLFTKILYGTKLRLHDQDKLKLWEAVRSFYTLEEAERECFHILKGTSTFENDEKDGFYFMKFKSHYFALQEKERVIKAATKQELLKKMVAYQEERWEQTITEW